MAKRGTERKRKRGSSLQNTEESQGEVKLKGEKGSNAEEYGRERQIGGQKEKGKIKDEITGRVEREKMMERGGRGANREG